MKGTALISSSQRRSAAALGLALSTTLLVSACSFSFSQSSSSTKNSATAEIPTETTTSTTIATSTTTTTANTPRTQVEIPINKMIDDPDTQDHIEVISAIRNFPAENNAAGPNGEVVLLQVKIVPGQVYSGSVTGNDFSIIWDGNNSSYTARTSIYKEKMIAAGFTPVENVKRRDGGEHVGWIALAPGKRADTYTIDYTRDPAEVISVGSEGGQIPAFTATFDIPAAP